MSVKTVIPHSKPTLGQEEIDAVSKVIALGHIAQGEISLEFERAFAEFMGVSYAASASSGTAALHLVLAAMGIGPGHQVIIPSYVCTALFNAVCYTGAVPVCADICPETFNICPDHVKKLVNSRTRAVIVPHMFGMAADIDAFPGFGVPVIEDCAQSAGSLYKGKKTGSFGYAGIFSFYATKMLTTGEGGMVVSRSKSLIDKIKDLKNYDNRDDGRVRFNYKMTDMQAALGLVQLKKLPEFIKLRKAAALMYDKGLAGSDLRIPHPFLDHIYYRYVVSAKNDSSYLISELNKQGIHSARPVFMPIHRVLKLKGFENTEKAWKHNLSIPIYPGLTVKELQRIIKAVVSLLHV
ncbi:GDP-perosamine synthase [Desulfonema limicola]|uniref:GDP-perosamine synthase n=1 Tax=Desulfonema limicola TaxID=45656 RepID=A0A975B611_9BACT|nr:DegT/DnrJ/EryC1/StrS aminotransferase family protein [Desulfonema limicola]QTA79465.1 GDP-perosamine synthase [Desulfonema limicola]